MPPVDPDVNPAESSAAVAPEAAPPADTESGAVTPVGPDQPVGRTLDNVVGEFSRKFGKLQSQMESLVQYVALAQRSQPASQASPTKGDPTDDELWSLAQQGDRTAFDVYMGRIADRKAQVQMRTLGVERLVEAQLNALSARYPVLGDATHPLSQQVSATYQALLANGYPAHKGTVLEAVKVAIADRPDLVSELHQASRTTPLRRDRAQAGVTGATTREEPLAPSTRSRPLTEGEVKLAQRMGIKDPQKAKERFAKRQEHGQSSFGAVASYLREE